MSMTIRNQLPGTVTGVEADDAMAVVKVRLAGGQEITAAITAEAARDLALAEDAEVRALVKSTEVALADAPVPGLSIRNQLAGTVLGVVTGGPMATVKVSIEAGELTAAITREAVEDLGLFPGSAVVALVKSTEVSLAIG